MAIWTLYVLGAWNHAATPRHPAILDVYPHPQIDSIEDVTGQLTDRIPPNPNLAVWYIQCRAAVANAINNDANYAILAGRQVWDNWYLLPNGTYTGVDEGSPAPEGGVSVSLDEVPWRLTQAMRVALRTWLMGKGLTLAQARALVKDNITGELDAKEIVTLARAWLAARPHA
uniref:Uncharacterized protein n=1 Tax=viral metagenome TaxID=1070528 RepID=A0A6M3KSJ4_9ZZZZ